MRAWTAGLGLLLASGCVLSPERDNPQDPTNRPTARAVIQRLVPSAYETRTVEFDGQPFTTTISREGDAGSYFLLDARSSSDPNQETGLTATWEVFFDTFDELTFETTHLALGEPAPDSLLCPGAPRVPALPGLGLCRIVSANEMAVAGLPRNVESSVRVMVRDGDAGDERRPADFLRIAPEAWPMPAPTPFAGIASTAVDTPDFTPPLATSVRFTDPPVYTVQAFDADGASS